MNLVMSMGIVLIVWVFIEIGFILMMLFYPNKSSIVWQYCRNQAVSLDQWVNARLGGDPDETISSRCAKRRGCIFCGLLCNLLDRIDPGHCNKVIEKNEGADGLRTKGKRLNK